MWASNLGQADSDSKLAPLKRLSWANGREETPLDLRHLRYIVASARNGSFSAAVTGLTPGTDYTYRVTDADASVRYFAVLACGALPGAKAAVSSLAASEKDAVVKDALAQAMRSR